MPWNPRTFNGMIENGGDAYEAAEECYGMIWWLAAQNAALVRPLGTGPPPREDLLDIIARAAERYRDGLKLGGVQRDR